MKIKYWLITSSLCLFIFSCHREQTMNSVIDVDICVYGGTSAGVIAAYSAHKMGKSVVLIEPGKYLGGMTTGGLGMTDIGNKYAVTGLARLFYRQIGKHYNKFEQWTFPPSVATKVINQFVEAGDLNVLYNRRIISSVVENKNIKAITLESSKESDTKSLIEVHAKQFIDCSYEGDLMAKSGVSYTTGRESNAEYGETLNGVQISYWHQFPDGIDPYKIEGDSTSGLCWGINNNTLKDKGSGDKLIQAYNFRLCLTDVPENRRPFEKPETYDPSKYELLARALKKMEPTIDNFLLFNWGIMPDHKYDVNNKGPLSTDMIGMNYEYPEGSYETREKIWKDHVEYTKGLLYFMTHDERVPEQLRNKISEFGWAKDEFVDNDNFPTQLYIRESRRLIGEYVMTQKNCQGTVTVDDGVGFGAYGMDSHNCQRIVINGMVKNEGDVQVGGFSPYPISYRSIVPKQNECQNLIVPVCLSATHIAYGSIRMEPVFMVLGQSAAIASSLAIDDKKSVQNIDVHKLQTILANDPYLDGLTPEILVDDTDSLKIKMTGNWSNKSGNQSYKSGYKFANGINASFTLNPVIKESSKYEIYFFCPSLPEQNMPQSLSFEIKHADGTEIIQIDLLNNKNSWVSLGVYNCLEGKSSYVKLTATQPTDRLFADAVLWVPQQ